MSNFESLLFILVGSIVGRSGAISCYSCQYASTLPEWTTCAEPFDATNAPTCTGSVCSIGFGNYTGSPSFTSFIRNCTSGASSPADECQKYKTMLREYNYTYYTVGNTCCVGNGISLDDGSYAASTTCFCDTNKCNSEMPLNTGYNMPSTSFQMKPVSKLSLCAVAVMTVLSAI